MKVYKTLLFDADGTLLDFEAAEKKALEYTFHIHGYPFTETIRNRYLEMNAVLWKAYEDGELTRKEVIYTRFGSLFQELGIEDDGIAFEDGYQHQLGQGHDRIYHAMEVIQTFAQSHDLYIVTNGVSATQYSRLQDAGLDPYFKKVFVSEEMGYRKPMIEYFDYCFSRIPNIQTSNTLIIGDSLTSDMQGGVNAGIDTCWYNPLEKENDKDILITYEIKDLRELYNIVGKEQQ